jgi:hypothetical protein
VRVTILPLVVLMLLVQAGGVIALFQSVELPRARTYVLISLFMGANAIFYALALSRFPLERFAAIKRGYILSAVLAALLGIAGYFARHRVKPGVTGWAQINGWRGEVDSEEKIQKRVEFDLYYIENWSVLFDTYILLKTPIALLKTENAY